MQGWIRLAGATITVNAWRGCAQFSQRSWLLVMCLTVGGGSSLTGQETDLFAHLFERGLRFTDQVQVLLPAPTLQPEMPPQARDAVLGKLAGKQGWERFSRDSIMAPVTINIDSVVDGAGERLGLSIHSAFVVHAELAHLGNLEAMEEIFGSPADAQAAAGVVTQQLTAEQLREFDFAARADSSTTFAYIELPLLNKVLVRGVIRIEKRERAGAIEFVWQLDPSFNSSAQYSSRWTKLERDAVGKLVQGESFPYEGCGGFLGAYEIGTAAKPVLIESRLLIHEPQEWFAGSHFLRSKIPSLMQENARSLRRKLADHRK